IIIGITFTFMMALAVLFIGLLNFYSVQVYTILLGNLLYIPIEDFYMMIFIGVIVTIIVLLLRKELYFMTFDLEMAKLTGIRVRLLNYLFLILVALTISVSIRGIGAILVFAMVVVPSAAAYLWTFKLNRMIYLSVIFGIFSTISGLYLSFIFDLPTGSSIVMVVMAIFFISFVYSPKRMATKNIYSCKYCNATLLKGEECEDCLARGIKHLHDGEVTRIARKDLPQTQTIYHDHHKENDEEMYDQYND
ncbi:MAG: metal ABC transporter permease, partial [Candidatus Thorarchaeota archaeon]